MSLATPIAFMIFNRPDLTRSVFEAIAKAKPEKLFVIADGPRSPEEAEKCAQTRAVIDAVDWNCAVCTNFSDRNLGCGRRIAGGIDWVFSNVEEAIFLEDDCFPAESFFTYCQTLLERYRAENRVMTINGNSFQSGHKRTAYSYHFSKYNGCWGWASWRRAWKHYDYEIKTWPRFRQSKTFERLCQDRNERQFWIRLFDSVHEDPDRVDTWDHQWKYACWANRGLAIEPMVNLVANLGLGRSDATHTKGTNPLLERLSRVQDIGPLDHPPVIERCTEADAYLFPKGRV